MNQKLFRGLAYLLVSASACFSTNLYAGLFNSDNSIHVIENTRPSPNTPASKYAATIRIAGYTDARPGMTPKKIGLTSELVSGHSGKELALNIDVTELVANSIQKRFNDGGFQLLDSGALYELGGTVKELTYNVKARDEISIAIETTLKETATGQVVWSGLVTEKDERYAGVSGNSTSDIAAYLQHKLGIVTKKTYDAISASLMASRPDLFNMTPGTKPILGVTVLQAAAAPASAPLAPASHTAAAASGTLELTTKPARAKVYLDGIYFGMSPLHAEVETGIHEVSVKIHGYKTGTEKISIRTGETTELEMALEH